MKRLSALGFRKKLELDRYIVMVPATDVAQEVTP
jgi:hypothetical protein